MPKQDNSAPARIDDAKQSTPLDLEAAWGKAIDLATDVEKRARRTNAPGVVGKTESDFYALYQLTGGVLKSIERARDAAAKVRELKEIPDRIGGWTDKEAYLDYNDSYSKAYWAALAALGDLIGKDNAEAMFGVPA